MNKFTGSERAMDTLASAEVVTAALSPSQRYAQYVGLDVHKDTIAVALAAPGRGEPHYYGEIAHTPKAVKKLVQRLSAQTGSEQLLWCYEAGPCGYGLYRLLLSLGQACEVVAPPTRERIKTDRRDALKLSRKLRAGELRQVWVPGVEQEAMRDFTRCRSDFKAQQLKARQQLNAFVLREYMEAVEAASERLKQLEAELLGVALPQWSLAPVVDSLVALRGIDKVAAVTLLAELGDVSRFDSPRELMGFLGLVPSVHDSGQRRGRRGAITRMGNGHARRMLVETAWCYRFQARQTAHLKRKAGNASREAKAIAWQAQKRLCGRYRALLEAGKNKNVTCVAVARELAGFVWAIVCQEMPKLASA